jgi:hypothetical protein
VETRITTTLVGIAQITHLPCCPTDSAGIV